MSKPRPIHSAHRDIRSSPDEAEPSYSYEQELTLGRDQVDDVEDEFHRRLAGNSSSNNRRDSHGSSNSVIGGTSSGLMAGAGSFWRTDAPGWQQGPSFSSMNMKPSTDTVMVNERKSSGGLLGAALQLHSQSEGHAVTPVSHCDVETGVSGLPSGAAVQAATTRGGAVSYICIWQLAYQKVDIRNV